MAENWYMVMGLEFDPPEENEQVIFNKLEECKKEWSVKYRNDAKNGAYYGNLIGNIKQIQADMLGESNIRTQLAKDACTQTYGPIDRFLKAIGGKGEITSQQAESIAKEVKVDVALVKKRATSLKLKWVEASSQNHQEIYDTYYQKEPEKVSGFRGMKGNFEVFQVATLYEFLYQDTNVQNAHNQSPEELLSRAKERKKEFIKRDTRSTAGSNLCKQSSITFKDSTTKAQYDNFLQYEARVNVLKEVKSCHNVFQKLPVEEGEKFIAQLTQILKDRKLAISVIVAYCHVENIPYHPDGESAHTRRLKVCRCGCTNDVSDGRSVCMMCGLALEISCPKCKEVNDCNTKVCKCGFQFAHIDRAIALFEQAELAIESLEFEVAKAHLKDGLSYWNESPMYTTLSKQLAEYESRVGAEVEKLKSAMETHCYIEAQEQYQRIQKLFPKYESPVIAEKLKVTLAQAKAIFTQAKAETDSQKRLELCGKAYELCADYPGIKELIPPPDEVGKFQVNPNPLTRKNILSWEISSDRSIKYVVVRSTSGWVTQQSDGVVLYEGASSSYSDGDIHPATPYYYNVFACRAGVYSQGFKGSISDGVNLFELKGFRATSGDGSIQLAWDKVPTGATVQLYQIEGSTERHLSDSTGDFYLVDGLVNEKEYEFRGAISYQVNGKKRSTAGCSVAGTPYAPPEPVDTLQVKSLGEGKFDAIWCKPKENQGELCVFASLSKPEFLLGDMVSKEQLELQMAPIQRQPLSSGGRTALASDEDGFGFIHTGKAPLYVVAVVMKSGSGAFGNPCRASEGESVSIKSVNVVNGKICISVQAPEKASGFVVLSRFDTYASDISDTKTTRKYVAMREYQRNSAIILDNVEEKDYYFSIFTEFKYGEDKDYSTACHHLFRNRAKAVITYRLDVKKQLLGANQILLKFQSNQADVQFPDFELYSSVGSTPMFKSSAQLVETIDCTTAKGSHEVKFPLPKSIPRNTYMKVFLKDEALASSVQLTLDVKSTYKIS